jgi:hypothetical protein
MPTDPRRASGKPAANPVTRTTADAVPSLGTAVRTLPAGQALDDLVGRTVLGLSKPKQAQGVSGSWDGARRVIERLTGLGCYVQMQVHADQCICQVLRVLEGAAVAKQLSVTEAPSVPEAVAKAAVLACLQMEPPGE